MAQDLRDLMRHKQNDERLKMSAGHQERFLNKLDTALPKSKEPKSFNFWSIAASVVVLLGLSYGAMTFFNQPQDLETPGKEVVTSSKITTLGDVSPELKKVEDYYLASINLQLANIELTPENKELFDGYLLKLEELNKEYKSLSLELSENGPNALTIDALINNLKLRLNLLERMQEQLQDLKISEEGEPTVS